MEKSCTKIEEISLQNCAGITSGSRSSSSNSVEVLMSLLPLLLYCHRGLDFEYFWFITGNVKKWKCKNLVMCHWESDDGWKVRDKKTNMNGQIFQFTWIYEHYLWKTLLVRGSNNNEPWYLPCTHETDHIFFSSFFCLLFLPLSLKIFYFSKL